MSAIDAIVGRPDDGGREHPGVLLFADAFGLRPQIQAMADRIASWGYVVLAPHLFHRDGTVAELAPQGDLRTPEGREAAIGQAMTRVRALTPDLIVADAADHVAALRGLVGVADGPLGATGYCMGGAVAVRTACARPDDIAAVGSFHAGRLATDAPDSPHLGLADARAAFVFAHADQDPSMPPEAIALLERTLSEHGLEFASATYPDAPHGFTMADTSSYQEAGAERHYRELRDLLAARL
ncbi:dienelactone hydrolase family protein [Nocardioides humi]|uniref:Dienelactone hydrolase family protein n=1 Tax=Nocardioides humi TaxID=449461 RepID=A0ABN2A2Y1_9ACTN|nr:dienelactone hydrolase family protein [Nocardioides humi]